MEPINIDNFEQQCIEWSNNNNIGVEYEFALYYLLLDNDYRDIFNKLTIYNHIKKDKILQIIEIQRDNIYQQISKPEYTLYKYVYLATQDDTVGPADIVLYENDDRTGNVLGLSVKYNNSCNVNMSSSYFLTANDKDELKKFQKDWIQNHIDYLVNKKGHAKNWFRQRKCGATSYSVSCIDIIRNRAIHNWNNGYINKQDITDKLYQSDSPIDYKIWKFTKKKLKVLEKPFFDGNINEIIIDKYRKSYLGLYINDNLICKIQVKFNNGILERSDPKSKNTICVDDIYMKMGDAFGSWNCTPVK